MKKDFTRSIAPIFYSFLGISLLLLISCGGGGGGDTTAPAPTPATDPEEVTVIVAQTGAPIFSGFDLQFKQGDFWLYDWKDVSSHDSLIGPGITTTTTTGAVRITLGSPRIILGITFFQVIGEYTGSVPEYRHIEWQYIASFNNKIYGFKDNRVFLIFDAQNGNWVGGTFFGGVTSKSSTTRDLIITVVDSIYSVLYPESIPNLTFQEFYSPSVGPSGYRESYESRNVLYPGDYTHSEETLTIRFTPLPTHVAFSASDFSGKTLYHMTSTRYERIDFFANGTLRAYPQNDDISKYMDGTWMIINGNRLRLDSPGTIQVYYTLLNDDVENRYYKVSRVENGAETFTGFFYDQVTGLSQAQDFVANHRTP